MATIAIASHCVVHDGRGETTSIALSADRPRLAPPRTATIAGKVPIGEIMCRKIVCARADLPVDALARLMMHHRIGCIPIVDDMGRPQGMVTKSDLVEQIDAALHPRSHRRDPADLSLRTANDVMMALAVTLDENATVAEVALMMVMEDLHHVMVVSQAKALVGIVSAKDVVRWIVDNDGLLAEPS